jgi:hypothetical protein
MQIDNRKQSSLINIIFSLIIIATLVVLATHYISDTSFCGEEMVIPLWAVLIGILLTYRYGGFEYVSFDFNDDDIDIKYYRLFPFGRKYNRIIIPNELLGDFKIQKGIGTIFSSLILYQNRGGAMAQYPPVGMAAITKEIRHNLLKELNDIRNN